MSTLKSIFIVGTGHQAYQTRPRCGPQDGADAFKLYIQKMLRLHACRTIAEEMSIEALGGRKTVGAEVATEENLIHIFCDPTRSERQSLGIAEDSTQLEISRRENEWLRRVEHCGIYPILFVCGANHVYSFAQICRDHGLASTILTSDFEVPEIPLDRRII